MMQYLQAHNMLKVSDFNGSLSLFQKILTSGCSKELVTMVKDIQQRRIYLFKTLFPFGVEGVGSSQAGK